MWFVQVGCLNKYDTKRTASWTCLVVRSFDFVWPLLLLKKEFEVNWPQVDSSAARSQNTIRTHWKPVALSHSQRVRDVVKYVFWTQLIHSWLLTSVLSVCKQRSSPQMVYQTARRVEVRPSVSQFSTYIITKTKPRTALILKKTFLCPDRTIWHTEGWMTTVGWTESC